MGNQILKCSFPPLSVVRKPGVLSLESSFPSPIINNVGGGVQWRGNEPAGMTTISQRDFDAVTESNWGGNQQHNLSIDSVLNAPRSAPNVLKGKFPQGIVNTKPWAMFIPGDGTGFTPQYRRVYYCVYFRVLSGWYGTSKFMFFKPVEPDNTPGATHFFAVGREGGVSGACDHDGFRFRGQTQGSLTNTVDIYNANITNTIYRYDQWILIEIELFFGDPGQSNGEWRWWIDGVQQAEYTGQDWFSAGATDTGKLWGVSHEPTWNTKACGGGGGNDPNPNTSYWEFDASHLSGAVG